MCIKQKQLFPSKETYSSGLNGQYFFRAFAETMKTNLVSFGVEGLVNK